MIIHPETADPATLVDRLRGVYRIPITDGLGPAGGDEPSNPTEFVRRHQASPIQHAAAAEIERLRAEALEARRLYLSWMSDAAKAMARAERLFAVVDALLQHETSGFLGPDAEKNRRASYRGVVRKARKARADVEAGRL
ncbi:hypothetical protein [Roseomonas sp. USHLN139]|uniref:hypothetical protein n=1 Tax=Roseomonas sp. USHLN139 TaxID=3081298 RepID=UPI003B01E9F7